MANWLVEKIPKTIAPNTITLIGFLHSVIPFAVLVILTKGSMLSAVPRWFFFWQAWSYFAYRMLDEMDGKQARRTGNSSPLGLLFDHGCDIFGMGMQTIIYLIIAKVGNN